MMTIQRKQTRKENYCDEDDLGFRLKKGWAEEGGCQQGSQNDELSPRVFGVTPQPR